MSWVDNAEATEWIREHALKVEGSSVDYNGHYKEGKQACCMPEIQLHVPVSEVLYIICTCGSSSVS